MNKRIVVALDFAQPNEALKFIDTLDPQQCRVKVGKELFTAGGPDLIAAIHARNFEVFLDLKFHDIPNTVAKAVAAAAELGVWMVNVHASGGEAMLKAARAAIEPYGEKAPLLIAVTVLTSMSAEELKQLGVQRPLQEHVLALAKLSAQCGLDGVVCSAQEAELIKTEVGRDFILVTPGIRPAGSATHDQQRIMTPQQAVAAGVDYLVMGRPIRESKNPVATLSAIADEISSLAH
ncbi:orotidine-5'-phosphate decarboxylase [Aliidiomarina haloalkalitolerans]|uniref:Orotidine 5'-phosphate decarboxylase n=1 Tax=Aliidiomarina haloalkalitolerans TaxID=859059 RepID=A0A432VYI5_9GAMM|nr:orotidine-5'-phosphate decarboxylase [Aliidiomarina haloalkalitolerans]RUO21722.1 orotidine-5'-phosphate decarboxylase [Aliidiomarina haloalkalitolerans]